MKKFTLITFIFCIGMLTAQETNYTIKNIDQNTKYSDFGASYYGDSVAVFASTRKDLAVRKRRLWEFNKQPFLELYKGTVSSKGELRDIERFSEVLNTKYHESNVTFTKDLKTVYFSRNNYLDKKYRKDSTGVNLIQLYRARIDENGEWADIEPMPFNSNNYQTGHPSLNEDGDKLYFTSDMPGSIGLTDIYVVDVYRDGTFGVPLNLGPNVNTEKKEMFPYIDSNNILYFSSDGFEDGKGGLDIYATKVLGSEGAEPAMNLEYPINTDKDDFGMVFKSGKNYGYFSSNRLGGKGDDDIYSFNELEPLSFGCTQLVQGVVKENGTNVLLPGAKVDLYNAKGEIIESMIADKTAAFKFIVACNESYKIVVSKEEYKGDTEHFITTKEQDLKFRLDSNLDSNLKPKEFVNIRGLMMVNINPIYFDLNKSSIRSDAAIELEKIAKVMKKYPKLRIELGSHTDSKGPDKYNWILSNERVQSTLAWLIDRGVDGSRISGKGYGETQLVNNCSNGTKCSDAAHQLNRRTEFVILNPEILKNK